MVESSKIKKEEILEADPVAQDEEAIPHIETDSPNAPIRGGFSTNSMEESELEDEHENWFQRTAKDLFSMFEVKQWESDMIEDYIQTID